MCIHINTENKINKIYVYIVIDNHTQCVCIYIYIYIWPTWTHWSFHHLSILSSLPSKWRLHIPKNWFMFVVFVTQSTSRSATSSQSVMIPVGFLYLLLLTGSISPNMHWSILTTRTPRIFATFFHACLAPRLSKPRMFEHELQPLCVCVFVFVCVCWCPQSSIANSNKSRPLLRFS